VKFSFVTATISCSHEQHEQGREQLIFFRWQQNCCNLLLRLTTKHDFENLDYASLRPSSNSTLRRLSRLFLRRSVKSCHILLSDDGSVKLSGNRNVVSMLNADGRPSKVHDYPKHDPYLLPWLSPEILAQVFNFIILSNFC